MGTGRFLALWDRAMGVASTVANAAGSVVVIIMMLLITADVFMRYVFNKPVDGTFEMVEYMMALVVSLGMAYTGIKRAHVSVELVVSRFSPRVQAFFDIFNFFVCTVLFFLMSWKTGVQAVILGKRGLASTVLAIPVYPFVWVLSFGCVLLGLVFLLFTIESISKAVKP